MRKVYVNIDNNVKNSIFILILHYICAILYPVKVFELQKRLYSFPFYGKRTDSDEL